MYKIPKYCTFMIEYIMIQFINWIKTKQKHTQCAFFINHFVHVECKNLVKCNCSDQSMNAYGIKMMSSQLINMT